MARELTLNDMDKRDLVEVIANLKPVAALFTQEVIAQFVIGRETEALNHLHARIDKMGKAAERARSKTAKEKILKAAYHLVVRFNRKIDRVADLRERFPEEVKEEKKQ